MASLRVAVTRATLQALKSTSQHATREGLNGINKIQIVPISAPQFERITSSSIITLHTSVLSQLPSVQQQPTASHSSQPHKCTLRCLHHLTPPLLQEGPGDLGGDAQVEVMTFGKHKGRPLADLPADYVTWMENNGVLANRHRLRNALIRLGKLQKNILFTYPQHVVANTKVEPLPVPYGCAKAFLPPAPLSFPSLPSTISSTSMSSPEPPLPLVGLETQLISESDLDASILTALAPFRAVPPSLPANVVFLDIENVYVTDIQDIASSHLVQIGAVDGEGREMQVSVRPPLRFTDVSLAHPFFVNSGFQRFFLPSLPVFASAWPAVAGWLFDPAQGRGVDTSGVSNIGTAPENPTSNLNSNKIFLVGHNFVKFDLVRIDQELRRISPVTISGAAPLVPTGKGAQALRFSTPVPLPSQPFRADGAPSTWRDAFFNPQLRVIDTLSLLSAFTGLPVSPQPGAWSLKNIHKQILGTDQVRAHDALQDARSVRSLFFADNLAGAFFRYELNRAMTQGKTVAEERAMEGIASNGNGSGNSRSHEIKVGSGPNDNASKQPLIDFIVD